MLDNSETLRNVFLKNIKNKDKLGILQLWNSISQNKFQGSPELDSPGVGPE